MNAYNATSAAALVMPPAVQSRAGTTAKGDVLAGGYTCIPHWFISEYRRYATLEEREVALQIIAATWGQPGRPRTVQLSVDELVHRTQLKKRTVQYCLSLLRNKQIGGKSVLIEEGGTGRGHIRWLGIDLGLLREFCFAGRATANPQHADSSRRRPAQRITPARSTEVAGSGKGADISTSEQRKQLSVTPVKGADIAESTHKKGAERVQPATPFEPKRVQESTPFEPVKGTKNEPPIFITKNASAENFAAAEQDPVAAAAKIAAVMNSHLSDNGITEAAGLQVWNKCVQSVPDVTVAEILEFVAAEGQDIGRKVRRSHILNPVGLYIHAIAEACNVLSIEILRANAHNEQLQKNAVPEPCGMLASVSAALEEIDLREKYAVYRAKRRDELLMRESSSTDFRTRLDAVKRALVRNRSELYGRKGMEHPALDPAARVELGNELLEADPTVMDFSAFCEGEQKEKGIVA